VDQECHGVAAETAEAMAAVGAQVVFVGGDPKALGVLRELLPTYRMDVPLVDVSGGRGGEDAEAALRQSVDTELAAASQRIHKQAMDDYREAFGRRLAVRGIPAVADAFAAGNVRTLLLLRADGGAAPSTWGRRPGRGLSPVPRRVSERRSPAPS
jgi:hypothetical protein